MKRKTGKLMEVIKHFADKHGLDRKEVRKDMEKALKQSLLKGLCDAEFFVETAAFLIAREIKRQSWR